MHTELGKHLVRISHQFFFKVLIGLSFLNYLSFQFLAVLQNTFVCLAHFSSSPFYFYVTLDSTQFS